MKKLLSILFTVVVFTAPCKAQFGSFRKILKGAKTAIDARNTAKKGQEDTGNRKVKDIYNDPEHQKAREEAERQYQQLYEENLKKYEAMAGDSAAYEQYIKELTGGKSLEEYKRSLGIDPDSKEYQDAYAKTQQMSGLNDDPVFKKIMAEQRQPTMAEATYLNEKYGTSFEYEGMEALNDSVGVFAHLESGMKPMGITKFTTISDDKPVPDFGQDAIKQYVQDYISFLKKPLADREIVDSVQNYMIYDGRHADEQFKGTAKFTLYSNLETNMQELKVNEFLSRKISDFTEPIDPKNIFVFKVHKGIGCRYMEYMYSKISYKQSELMDYISKRLVNEGYIDANINQKLSDDELFKAIDKMEFQFKVERLLKIRQNKDKFLYTNIIPEAKNVKLSSRTRKIGHVTALDITIDAEPGEYAFIIRKPEVEQYFKQMKEESEDKDLQNFDISVLTEGAFFFTIK